MAKSKYKVDFPFMRAYGRMTEIDFMNVQDRLTMATVENAPWNAVFKDGDKWVLIGEMTKEMQDSVVDYADKFYTSQSRPKMATTTGQLKRILP